MNEKQFENFLKEPMYSEENKDALFRANIVMIKNIAKKVDESELPDNHIQKLFYETMDAKNDFDRLAHNMKVISLLCFNHGI